MSVYVPIKMAYIAFESVLKRAPFHPLIIMHGMLTAKEDWVEVAESVHKLCPWHRVILVDARDHGDSPHSERITYEYLCADVKHFLEHSNISKASLMGHSMGGRTMMYFALKHPNLVDKLINVDVSPFTSSAVILQSVPEYLRALSAVCVSPTMTLSLALQEANLQLESAVPNKVIRSYLLTNFTRKPDGTYGWRNNIKTIARSFSDITECLPCKGSFSGPTLFLLAEKSEFFLKSEYEAFRLLFPNVTFKEIEGVGHWMHRQKPDVVVKSIVEFLNS